MMDNEVSVVVGSQALPHVGLMASECKREVQSVLSSLRRLCSCCRWHYTFVHSFRKFIGPFSEHPLSGYPPEVHCHNDDR